MKKQLQMVKDFHVECQINTESDPKLIETETALNRYKMMREEVEEYLEGTQNEDLPNIAKELCDILYTTYGTII
jgi:predicted HAD superfamily Cof-like phosphohydrolase